MAKNLKSNSKVYASWNKKFIQSKMGQSKDTGQRTRIKEANSESEVMQQLKEAIDFCVGEFREKHGDSKKPNIVIDTSERGRIHVQADNY